MAKAQQICRTGSLIAALALLAAAPAAVSAAPALGQAASAPVDWPQWRGPNRDAVAVEQGLLKEWQAGGPEVLWRIPVGKGFSSISVSQGRLYTLWDEGQSEFLVSLDAATGKELWRHRLDASFVNSWGNGPRSTPAVDSGMVYAVSAQGNLHAVTAEDGRTIWSHDLATEYGGTIPAYGYSSSPMIEGDKLFVEAGGQDNLAFIAFDKSTGDLVWASQADAAAYSSPLAITVGGVRQVGFFSASGLFAVAPEDGSLLWKHPWDSSCPATGIPTNVAHPIFIPPDKIFVSNGYGTMTGSAVFRIDRRGEKFATETVWRSEAMRNLLNSSILHDKHIYGFDIGILKAIDAATGKEQWKARGFERGSLIAADGQLIVLGEQGNLALVEATPGGFRQKGSAQILEGKSWTMPTLADGRLFLRNQSEMVSLDLRASAR
jgi:outer membrane protein assembly factor BamB